MTQPVPESDPPLPSTSSSAPEVEAIAAERDALAEAIELAVEEELKHVPEARRSLVPENLAPVDALAYLVRNRELLQTEAPTTPASAFAGEKPLPGPGETRPWNDLTYAEKVRLARERPDRFRRLREAHLRRDVVATK